MSGRTEHDLSAFGATTGRVRSKILGTHVGLALDDTADALFYPVVMYEVQSDEFARNPERVLARIERVGEFLGHVA